MIWLGILLITTLLYYIISDRLFMKQDLSKISKVKLYKDTIARQWLIVLMLGIIWGWQGFEWKDWVTSAQSWNSSIVNGLLIGIIAGICFSLIMPFFLQKKGKAPVTVGNIDFFMPQTRYERIWFVFVAITAGICEELIFRGAMTYFLFELPVELPLWTIGLLVSILFSMAHLYQGISGIVATSFLGVIFFVLFIGTGSLLLPIILHFMMDVRFALMPRTKTV
ncbi:CPBP family intramembrane metalloprotease [Metasolibacillus meyeri]|uniref:CPBP family intramembrane metalloprotease n=1 Tax=Metasolibacillus meyeri TaxID=1071052 RepID=A0AAW9NRC9_9BACL|nr:CPBP family intramembrane glutamic endopeptidase [Metasolibacillus meyeri]MEC1177894.1 CPBP family intramembrane metalloprotease [Metasolibacillus meyeri]